MNFTRFIENTIKYIAQAPTNIASTKFEAIYNLTIIIQSTIANNTLLNTHLTDILNKDTVPISYKTNNYFKTLADSPLQIMNDLPENDMGEKFDYINELSQTIDRLFMIDDIKLTPESLATLCETSAKHNNKDNNNRHLLHASARNTYKGNYDLTHKLTGNLKPEYSTIYSFKHIKDILHTYLNGEMNLITSDTNDVFYNKIRNKQINNSTINKFVDLYNNKSIYNIDLNKDKNTTNITLIVNDKSPSNNIGLNYTPQSEEDFLHKSSEQCNDLVEMYYSELKTYESDRAQAFIIELKKQQNINLLFDDAIFLKHTLKLNNNQMRNVFISLTSNPITTVFIDTTKTNNDIFNIFATLDPHKNVKHKLDKIPYYFFHLDKVISDSNINRIPKLHEDYKNNIYAFLYYIAKLYYNNKNHIDSMLTLFSLPIPNIARATLQLKHILQNQNIIHDPLETPNISTQSNKDKKILDTMNEKKE